jgi:beta-mannosidase
MNDVGTAHYFGVGAYLRPLDDARRADVRFATECLAFANVPDAAVVDALMDDGAPPQDPRWKARVPRDGGAGWDFDDVRDYYFRELFKMDPLPLRYADVGRYLALSRVVTGEVMAATFSEWRRAGTQCRGALVWFLRDLAPGAGWGLLDSSGGAKAAYSYLRRVLQPVAILLTDEGLNGLFVHLVNEGPEALDAEVRLTLYRGEARIANATALLELAARSSTRQPAAALFDSFHDATYAYRFGAPEHDVAVAALVARSSGARLGEAFHFPQGLPTHQEADLGLEGTIARAPDAALWRLTLRTRAFAQSVALDVPDYVPDDNYFHIAPGATREVVLRPTTSAARKPAGEARALNSRAKTKFVVSEETAPRP